jgi:hypothetical protein
MLKYGWRILAVLALCAYVAGLVIWASSDFPTPSQICEEAKNAANQNCTFDYIVSFVLWKILAWTGKHLLEIGTITLAAFVLIQVIDNRESSERQLRAYVFVDGGQFDYSQTHDAFRGHLVIKNYGQTPAYDFEVFASVRVFEPDAPIFDFTQLHPERSAKAPLGPTAEFNIDRTIRARPNDLQEVIDREKAIFMWGIATYRDAFGHRETLEFRCVSQRIRMSADTWGMEPYPESRSE